MKKIPKYEENLSKMMIRSVEETTELERIEREANLATHRKTQAQKDKQRQLELSQKRAGYRQASETCSFWTQQARSQNTVQNRMYRDQACTLVNQFR